MEWLQLWFLLRTYLLSPISIYWEETATLIMTFLRLIISLACWISCGRMALRMMVIIPLLLSSDLTISLVWRTTGTTWRVAGDIRLRTPYHRKIPRIASQLTWQQITSGQHPPRDKTYAEWIACQPYFKNVIPPTVCLFFALLPEIVEK